MARVSIYVPDDLKERMDRADDQLNWSEIVRPALLSAVANFEHREGPNMTTAIERLRASKQQAMQQQVEQGRADGRVWAEHTAEYDELKRVAKFDDRGSPATLDDLLSLVDPDNNMDNQERLEYLFGDDDRLAEEDGYVDAFIEGAAEFFAEVKDQL